MENVFLRTKPSLNRSHEGLILAPSSSRRQHPPEKTDKHRVPHYNACRRENLCLSLYGPSQTIPCRFLVPRTLPMPIKTWMPKKQRPLSKYRSHQICLRASTHPFMSAALHRPNATSPVHQRLMQTTTLGK